MNAKEKKNLIAYVSENMEEVKEKLDFCRLVEKDDNTIDVGDFAKSFGIGRNRFFEWLRSNKFLMHTNAPYQRYIMQKWFTSQLVMTSGDFSYFKPLLTPRGCIALTKKIMKSGFVTSTSTPSSVV